MLIWLLAPEEAMMAKHQTIQWPIRLEGELVFPGPDVTSIRTEDGRYAVEYRTFHYDSVGEMIEAGVLLRARRGGA